MSKTMKPLIVYCHSFSGCKLEGKELVTKFLPDMDVLLFDFPGCGNSKGEYVTLGINEAQDLTEIILKVQKTHGYDTIYLWGRSMGAVSVINMLYNIQSKMNNLVEKQYKLHTYQNHLNKTSKVNTNIRNIIKRLREDIDKTKDIAVINKSIKGIVLDSPFTTASKMVKTAIKHHADTNDLTTVIIVEYLKLSIKNNVGSDVIEKNRPKDLVSSLTVPATFFLGEKDELISLKSFRKMFEAYGSDFKKFRLLVNTDHSDERNEEDIDWGVNFIKKLYRNMEKELKEDIDEHIVNMNSYHMNTDKAEVVNRKLGSIRVNNL